MASTPNPPQRIELFDVPLDMVSLDQTLDLLSHWIFETTHTSHSVVTLNPEFIVQMQDWPEFKETIQKADLVTADGVGIVYATRRLKKTEVLRAPGLDIARGLLERHGDKLRVFFLGAKPGVAEMAAQKAAELYGIQIAGAHHGYFDSNQEQAIAQQIADGKTDLLLTGMGSGRQEIFNHYWRQLHKAPVALGCGGVIDVLAGNAQLAPAWTRKIGIEWLWRVGLNPERWGRIPRLLKFIQMVEAEKK